VRRKESAIRQRPARPATPHARPISLRRPTLSAARVPTATCAMWPNYAAELSRVRRTRRRGAAKHVRMTAMRAPWTCAAATSARTPRPRVCSRSVACPWICATFKRTATVRAQCARRTPFTMGRTCVVPPRTVRYATSPNRARSGLPPVRRTASRGARFNAGRLRAPRVC